jgi:aryl-alcohol dehydrogenase-like predicted oxidoreductase
MKYRALGRSGLLVSRICLGTMGYGQKEWGCDGQMANRITKRFIEGGGNFIDTADMYSDGESEEMLGEGIRGYDRDTLVIATKCWFRRGKTPNAKGLSRKHIMEACEASLRRLHVDYIDLYQIHGPDPATPLEETMRALDDLVRVGKVRYLGCSNHYGWQVVKVNAVSDRMGLERLVSGQYMYSLLRRDIEREILPACDAEGMGIMCWAPLASGMLSGKYRGKEKPEASSRIGLRSKIDVPRYWNAASIRLVEEVAAIAAEEQKTPSQVGLSWLLHDQRVTAVISGVRTVEQVEENCVSGDWDLPDAQWSRLEKLVPFEHGYPKDWMDLTMGPNIGGEEFPSRWKERLP